MSNLSYWERRQVENMYKYMQDAENAADQIAELYYRASRWLSLEADEIFERFMTKHNLTEAEARKLLNTLRDRTSIDEMLQKLKSGEYDESKSELIAKLESPAYQARIERLKQLQNQLDYVMENVYRQEKAINTAHYVDLANESYYRTIYDMQQRTQAAFSFNHIDSKVIDAVVNSKWSGKNYSSRIWKNTRALAQDIKEELLINLVTGRTEKEVADILANKFGQSASKARRLVRTESAYLSGELNFKAYKEMDIEEYQFLAMLDLKTSEICRKMDLLFFKVKDRKVGVNCPPMHPWCRSTTVAVVDRKYLESKKRAALDPKTGKTIYVPGDMNYEEWYRKYVEGDKENEKNIVNSSESDVIRAEDTKEVVDLHTIGKIDKRIYKCITEDMVTDEVIITDNQMQHILERHPESYEKCVNNLKEALNDPDYIIEDKHQNTGLVIKSIKLEDTYTQIVLRVCTSEDQPGYKNSIISSWEISEKRLQNYLRNKRILYRKE